MEWFLSGKVTSALDNKKNGKFKTCSNTNLQFNVFENLQVVFMMNMYQQNYQLFNQCNTLIIFFFENWNAGL